jgi:hypothetical protein
MTIMRILPLLAAIGAGLALTACTYVERERPAPVVLQQQPAPTTIMPMQPPPPTVTVRPSY